MEVFFFTFAVLLIVVFAMAIGYVLQRKTIAGSCGGMASVGIDKVCDCKDVCVKR
jgi:hypothetical protein